MIRGQLYYGFDKSLFDLRTQARHLLAEFNTHIKPDDRAGQIRVMRALFGPGVKHLTDDEMPFIEPPFRCDYGHNIRFGKNVYMNFNTTILDCAPVHIGDRVLFGPNCSVYTAEHPLSPTVRSGTAGPEFARPITIGNDCWLGGNVVVVSSVNVGDGCTVGAGSVVTRDLPAMSLAVGNPARVKRVLEEDKAVAEGIASGEVKREDVEDPRWVGLKR
ncbi:isoleucine patch superfamily [Catenaria anguillulae PL171]|uniref:Isoleucine patch superfamily n=1 Tax=Catenaria anguillulae PL171 TaxID=765915 RepID=A0A1Y2HT10_9FUNG|nr:isoleucine patch superfamily [Catenaria anguillulae PL171]